ncbi:FecR family protein [Mucilaginibacter phyllosphaerae]
MKSPIPVELLEKYLNGSCTEEEIALIKQWYHSFDSHHDHISGVSEVEEQEIEQRIYNRITEKIEVDYTFAVTGRSRYASILRWTAAAAVAAIFVGGFYFINNSKISFAPAAQVAKAPVEQVDIINSSNQIYKAVLPDSSIIWLHPGGNIRYPKVFAANARIIAMYGEGFFEVTKNAKRPFIINGRTIITKVWGTSFLIRDNYRSRTADVSVITGKVSVSIKKNEQDNNFTTNLEQHELLLYPNQKATYLIDKHLLKASRMIKEPALKIWTQAKLSFDNKPLREIIPVLNATYGVHIQVKNERLNHFMLNADFEGFNLPDVLAALKKSINVNYELKDDNIIELN